MRETVGSKARQGESEDRVREELVSWTPGTGDCEVKEEEKERVR